MKTNEKERSSEHRVDEHCACASICVSMVCMCVAATQFSYSTASAVFVISESTRSRGVCPSLDMAVICCN